MDETGEKSKHQIQTNQSALSDSFIKQSQGILAYQLHTEKSVILLM